jgi:hypothetical protein
MVAMPGGVEMKLRFRADAGPAAAEPVRFRVVRNCQTLPSATGFELNTGGNTLPCPLLAAVLDDWAMLGPESRFRGYFWANALPDGWQGGAVDSAWLDVELGGLLGEPFPHTLGGRAQITVDRAWFRRGRLEAAEGSITAGPGSVSRSLIDAAAEHLKLVRGVKPSGPAPVVRYERLSFGFRIDADGLRLAEDPNPVVGPRAILASDTGVLLGGPADQPLPIASLLQTLAPGSRHPIPGTQQTDWLARRLPLPETATAETRLGSVPPGESQQDSAPPQ